VMLKDHILRRSSVGRLGKSRKLFRVSEAEVDEGEDRDKDVVRLVSLLVVIVRSIYGGASSLAVSSRLGFPSCLHDLRGESWIHQVHICGGCKRIGGTANQLGSLIGGRFRRCQLGNLSPVTARQFPIMQT
jgi:hypothetical protein